MPIPDVPAVALQNAMDCRTPRCNRKRASPLIILAQRNVDEEGATPNLRPLTSPLQYDKVLFLLEPDEITRELRRKRVGSSGSPSSHATPRPLPPAAAGLTTPRRRSPFRQPASFGFWLRYTVNSPALAQCIEIRCALGRSGTEIPKLLVAVHWKFRAGY
jgi:hypothetical protein